MAIVMQKINDIEDEMAKTQKNKATVHHLGLLKIFCKFDEIMIGEYKLIHFSGVDLGQACTIVLRGASHHVLNEAERSLHDALCVMTAEFCLEANDLSRMIRIHFSGVELGQACTIGF
ncbi:hypothetical protein Q3G72_028055 [Acer saccharum]|nr:hypothetical protein Q3G72_028055 [Acer saccharum]